jgi:hypothetical protein
MAAVDKSVVEDEDDVVAELPDLGMTADELAEPTPEESGASRIQFVRTGLIRLYVEGVTFRLRRPFFGEFKALRLAFEDVLDEISEAAADSMNVQREVSAERQASVNDPPETLASKEREWRKRTRESSRALNDRAENVRIDWWRDVFETLSLDGTPELLPSWVIDPMLPNEFILHWRTAPQGRG